MKEPARRKEWGFGAPSIEEGQRNVPHFKMACGFGPVSGCEEVYEEVTAGAGAAGVCVWEASPQAESALFPV